MTINYAASATTEAPLEPYSTKRHGMSLANCDSEPVQTPGCVQAHGALLVLRLLDLTVLQVSDNALKVLVHKPENLLGQPVSAVLGLEGSAALSHMLATQPTERSSAYLLTLPGVESEPGLVDAPVNLDVTVHTIDGVAVLEFESAQAPPAEEPDYFALIRSTVARLRTTSSLRQFCESVAQEMRALTGMDRVLVYKFHADGHGEVFAESCIDGIGSWLGLHYPAEDIPKPAREAFCKTWIRPIPDVSNDLAELIPLLNPDTGKPLEMTSCALRGVSMMCTEYFRNMGVAATLTLPIRRDDQLWGLITGHHYAGPKPTNYRVRAACEFLAQVVSLQHQAAEDKEHLAYRLKLESLHQQMVTLTHESGGLAALIGRSPSLLDGIDAGGVALYHLERWWRIGSAPSEEQLNGLSEWLLTEKFQFPKSPLYATDSLMRDYPPAAAFAEVASGLLAVPLAASGRGILLWFRPEIIQTVNWGGNPHHKPTVMGPNGPRLTPRGSFDLFKESVQKRSFPWLEIETKAADALRHLLMEMVVDRAARLANLGADLARSNEELDAFAYVTSHDLKEPLRGITQYANQLLEGADQTSQANQGKLLRLKQLTQRMEKLLDSLVNYSRVGRVDLTLEAFDLNEVLDEAVQLASFRRTGIAINLPRPLPTVHCQRLWSREILANLLSNAKTFNDKPIKTIEVGYIAPHELHPRPRCPEGQELHTIFYVADNGIGIDVKHFSQIFRLFRRLHGRDDYGGGGGAGLTIVRKLVERHGGKVWLDSQPGIGSTFYYTLPGGEGS